MRSVRRTVYRRTLGKSIVATLGALYRRAVEVWRELTRTLTCRFIATGGIER